MSASPSHQSSVCSQLSKSVPQAIKSKEELVQLSILPKIWQKAVQKKSWASKKYFPTSVIRSNSVTYSHINFFLHHCQESIHHLEQNKREEVNLFGYEAGKNLGWQKQWWKRLHCTQHILQKLFVKVKRQSHSTWSSSHSDGTNGNDLHGRAPKLGMW